MANDDAPQYFNGKQWLPLNFGRAQSYVAWECPSCGCGVRGDVEVCPNCVKRTSNPQQAQLPKGYELDNIKAGGRIIKSVLVETDDKV